MEAKVVEMLTLLCKSAKYTSSESHMKSETKKVMEMIENGHYNEEELDEDIRELKLLIEWQGM